MRSTCRLLMLAPALMAAGCDRHSAPAAQENAAIASPDEVAPAASPAAAGRIDRAHKGVAAPTLAFTDPNGKPATLAAFRGKPVLVNLWATWCAPCVKELPTLDALAKSGKLRVVTINEDTDPAKAAPFLAGRKLTLPAYTDPKMAWVPAVAASLPTSILIDANGKEVWRTLGDLDWTGAEATEALAEAS